MSETDAELSGRVVADRYRLESKLGQGGMGSVWRAEHLMLGSVVAIKLIDPAVAQNEEIRARFVREARAAASLRSPHVVQIIDYGVDGDVPYIAMELMEGESLQDRLERVQRLPPEDVARIITEIARALTRAHQAGIVHRDLKPDNVFLVRNEDTEVAKVLDFGVAKRSDMGMEGANMTSTGAVLGTPYYMSPEQAEGARDLDARSDIWSLGVIAYECLVGVRPFEAESLGGLFLAICSRELPVPSQVADVPEGFDAWFAKAACRDLSQRYSTAKDAAQDLRALCVGESARFSSLDSRLDAPVTAASAGAAGSRPGQFKMTTGGASAVSLEPTGRANRTLWVGAVAALALLIALVVIGLSAGGESDQDPLVADEAVAEGEAMRDSDEQTASGSPATDPLDPEPSMLEEDVSEKRDAPASAKPQLDSTSAPRPTAAPRATPRVERPSQPSPQPSAAPSPAPRPAQQPRPTQQPSPAPAPQPTQPDRVDLGF